jgi:hypothetical protein
MICPHCSHELRFRERSGRTCSHCRKRFALEPRSNKLRLHDVKVRRLATKLGDDGRLRYSMTQLWYAAAGKQLRTPRGQLPGAGCVVVFLGAVAFLVFAAGNSFRGDVIGLLIPVIGGAAVLAYTIIVLRRRWVRREGVIDMPVPLADFRGMIGSWARVHGGPPPGLVDLSRLAAPPVPKPRLALLCQDRAVLGCLVANDVPTAYAMAPTSSPARLPSGVPVIVLHDASVAGCVFAAKARAGLPGRPVIDAGLRPRTALANTTLTRLREQRVPPERLAGLGLNAKEVDWLAQGWWSPLAAVSPKRLLAAVAKATERVSEAADPDRARARRVGFLTWPAVGSR